mmetsp:Transcript_14858/g.36388  ORF Transcript_14858/g.36388 Transcript_14858/m.36388 type:complete len:202 (-) Transcript_14858:5013-5618(-)
MQQVLPHSYPTRPLCQWSPTSTTKFVGIESHVEEIVDKNQEWSNRENDTEAYDKCELDNGRNILRERIVGWIHNFKPEIVLSLVQQHPFIDQSNFSSLCIRSMIVVMFFFQQFDVLQFCHQLSSVKPFSNISNQHEKVNLQNNIPPMRYSSVDHDGRTHSDNTVFNFFPSSGPNEGIVIHSTKLTDDAKAENLNDQVRPIL